MNPSPLHSEAEVVAVWGGLLGDVEDNLSEMARSLERLCDAVSQMKALVASDAATFDGAAAAADGVGELSTEVAPALPEITAQMAAEPSPGRDETPEAPPEAPDTAREEVRRAVERTRAELEADRRWQTEPDAVESAPPAEPAPAADEDALREQVRRAVELARAEIASGKLTLVDLMGQEVTPGARPAAVEEAGASEDAFLEQSEEAEVRDREAAAAPAEYMSPTAGEQADEETKVDTPAPARAVHPRSAALSAILSPVLTVDDDEGRVELVRVYQALKELGWAVDSSLVGYSPQSVSVALAPGVVVDEGALARAMERVFGRPCEVAHEENIISVRVSPKRAAA